MIALGDGFDFVLSFMPYAEILFISAKSGMFNINLHMVDHLMWFID